MFRFSGCTHLGQPRGGCVVVDRFVKTNEGFLKRRYPPSFARSLGKNIHRYPHSDIRNNVAGSSLVLKCITVMSLLLIKILQGAINKRKLSGTASRTSMKRQITAAYAQALMRAHFLPLRHKMCIVSSCSTFLGPYRMYVEHTRAVSRDGNFSETSQSASSI